MVYMKWLYNLFTRSASSRAAQAPAAAPKPVRTPAMERALRLSREDWVAEELEKSPISRIMAVKGIHHSHIHSLEKAGILNLWDLIDADQVPLMGAHNDWVRDWVQELIAELRQEYDLTRRAALKITP
jgi:hypothetical protein